MTIQGIRSISGRYKIDGEVKHSIGNREVKELVCTTYGHELRGEMLEGWGCRVEGMKGENWEKCNSIINKIYCKRKEKSRIYVGSVLTQLQWKCGAAVLSTLGCRPCPLPVLVIGATPTLPSSQLIM